MTATWNVESLGAAVDAITGEASSAVSWADADGGAVSRRATGGRPPQLVVGVCVRDDEHERLIRDLPGFVRLRAQDQEDLDGEPLRVLRAVFTRRVERGDDNAR
jgi:hypothetical protein